jgi:hypothetical protein
MIEMSQFFKYASKKDRVLMWVGVFSAIIAGAVLPLISIAQGEVTNRFDPSNPKASMMDRMRYTCLIICLVGIA